MIGQKDLNQCPFFLDHSMERISIVINAGAEILFVYLIWF